DRAGDDGHVILVGVVRVQTVPPHLASGIVRDADDRGGAVPGPLLILGGLGVAGPGTLVLQTHVVAGLVRGRRGGGPDVAVAEGVGEEEAAERVAAGAAGDASALGDAAVVAAGPAAVAADVDLRDVLGAARRGHGGDVDIEGRVVFGDDLPDRLDVGQLL